VEDGKTVEVERCVSRLGLVSLAGRQLLAAEILHTTLTVEFGDGDVRVIRRTTTQPVRSIRGQRPRTATPIS
jgi:hypothetical protein